MPTSLLQSAQSTDRHTSTRRQVVPPQMSLNCREGASGTQDEQDEDSRSDIDSMSDVSGESDEGDTPHRAQEIPTRAAEPDVERSSWTDLDLSIVVALVSPIGNWLTGGDHIKDLLLIALLIFYLHQLIQVPWELYRSSRPRRPHSSAPVSSEAAGRLAKLARTELRVHEFTYLMLSVASPLLGASFLRYILSTLNGSDPLSWFSTTLFVLATGMRPWTHLISRLRQRTDDLNDAIHYPSPESQLIAHGKLQAILERVDSLERELKRVKSRAAQAEGVEEVCDDLSGAVEDVKKIVRRNQKKADMAHLAQDNRIALLERSVEILLSQRPRPEQSLLFSLPSKIWSLLTFEDPPRHAEKLATQHHHHRHSSIPSPLCTPTRLETILEDSDDSTGSEDAAHAGEHVTHVMLPLKSGRTKSTAKPAPVLPRPRPASSSSAFIAYAAAIVTWPYLMSIRILAMLTVPMRKAFL
ncbi:hypothetical protein PLICRDRAFT_57946 [Plicaturopsis crispa FD-325 SS-3]|uniref:Uncharacterized protein n=1 Tax=Plicaturopsis crispa FD-325 SS-3 TaxID=944288 RepID=A0A0C9SX45_PLICR|nr:hypothetical protein PLICRDRAFT_57946 [Plicaturopsis crispa FD-325 SS-3]